jgi:hypothetical protein
MKRSISLAAAAALASCLGAAPSAAAARPAATFTALERAAFPAVHGPAAKALPKQIRNWDRKPIGVKYGANPLAARAVMAPDGSAHQMWYIIPARRGICLARLGAGTCQTFAGALAGHLWMQAIQPSNTSTTTPAPEGLPVLSRVVGLTPVGVTGVTATTKSGTTVSAVIRNGMFALSGSDMTSVAMSREPLTSPLFSG